MRQSGLIPTEDAVRLYLQLSPAVTHMFEAESG